MIRDGAFVPRSPFPLSPDTSGMQSPPPSWQTSRFRIDLSRPRVMGIVNVTPDSFSDGGRFATADAARAHCDALVREGADILDIGGESTRPGSHKPETAEEVGRV